MLSITNVGSLPQIVPFRGAAGSDSLASPGAGAEGRIAAGAAGPPQPGRPVSPLRPESVAAIQEESAAEEPEAGKPPGETAADEKAAAGSEDEQGLTEADRRRIEQLKQRDREVREHERAHATAGGSIAGSPSFTFVSGPDGRQYAVGGEVSIDVSPVSGNPQATIRKMEQVKRAALAPANPSGQDRRVASQADVAIIKAKQELAEERREEQENQREGVTALDRSANSIGRTDPVFDPQKRFRQPVGGAGIPLGPGLAGSGELKTNVGLTNPGDLLNMVA